MSIKPAQLRAEPHHLIGSVIGRDAGVIVEKWARRSIEVQPVAKRVHHDVLLDHLPTFLWELGKGLADSGSTDSFRHCRPAGLHGDQRWETGWSIEEVVRDYQLLRLIVTEHLNETVGRLLTLHEVMTIGVYFDDAIASSVSAFLSCSNASAVAPGKSPAAPSIPSGDFFSILGVLAHELRNPLAPLGNAVQVLKLSGNDPAVVEQTRLLMDRQIKSLTRLVNDLLDLPRLTQGKMPLRTERLDLCSLARDAVEDRRGAFDDAGVRLTMEVPEEPIHTSGDALRLTQVIGNLLGNAVKFTDRGGEVAVSLARHSGKPVAILAVRDTGIGIDEVMLTRIFEPFVQTDRGFERSRGGLGLGLALVKGIVELHGGSIAAKSRGPGTGTEILIELPFFDLPPESQSEHESTPPQPTARRMLIIEDNEDSAESLKLYLELLGHQVTIANSGPDGLQAAAAEKPDVIVCDIGLPGMSGHVVSAELKQIPALARTPIIALTGHPEDSSSSEQNGHFDHYLLKPVDPSHLAQIIQQLFEKPSAS